MAWTATQEDIEGWLNELGKKCDEAEYQEPYKHGYKNALVAVMGKMDDARKTARVATIPETSEHTYPSNYPPGKHWALDIAWSILDTLKPGVLNLAERSLLSGMIVGALTKVKWGEHNGG